MSIYYQSHNPKSICAKLSNQKPSFQLLKKFETWLSDHHKLIETIANSGTFEGAPRKIF